MPVTRPLPGKEATTRHNTFYHRALLLLSSALIALSGCEDGYNFPNEAPSQLAISKDVCYVTTGEEVPLSGSAYDEDGDPIYYQWSATAGTFDPPDGKGPSVIWKAPQAPGTVTITLSVTDDIEVSRTSETIVVGGSFPSYITESFTIADSGYVYILDKLQPVDIPYGVTLTIMDGVRIVVANENSGIDVQGRLVVRGTQGNEVIIGPASCVPEAGDWNGIRITGQTARGELDFFRIHSAENGIIVSSGASAQLRNCTLYKNLTRGIEASDDGGLVVTQCTVWENGTGVYVRNSELDMQRTSIRYNDEAGLELSATSGEFAVEVDTCTVANNETYGIYITGIVQPEIHYCSIYSNGSSGTGEAVWLEAYGESDSVRVDYNFWGIGNDSEEEISLLIHDRNDIVTGILAYIDFIPWLSSEPIGAP
jgi:hypothetical protein